MTSLPGSAGGVAAPRHQWASAPARFPVLARQLSRQLLGTAYPVLAQRTDFCQRGRFGGRALGGRHSQIFLLGVVLFSYKQLSPG